MKFGLKMAETLGTTDVTIVPKAGHMLPSERPFDVNTALRPFFTKS